MGVFVGFFYNYFVVFSWVNGSGFLCLRVRIFLDLLAYFRNFCEFFGFYFWI